MPETKIYNLHLDDSEKSISLPERHTGSSIAIHVEAPSYLSQPYIVTRTSPYQIQISKTAKWESTPKRLLRKGLRDMLSGLGCFRQISFQKTQPEGYFLLAVDLRKFERSDEEEGFWGELSMDVSLFDHEMKRLHLSTFEKKEKLGSRDFRDLAHVLSTLLAEGLEEVKGTIMQHVQKQH